MGGGVGEVRPQQEVSVVVTPATVDDKPLVGRLLELNAHDFSEIDGRDLGPHGEYGYPYLDHYWTETDRQAYLVTCGGRMAGCALVRLGSPHEMAEFFVVRKYRRTGVGTAAAREVFGRHPGRWAVRVLAGNDGASAFWATAIPAEWCESRDDAGGTRTFTVPDSAAPPPPSGR